MQSRRLHPVDTPPEEELSQLSRATRRKVILGIVIWIILMAVGIALALLSQRPDLDASEQRWLLGLGILSALVSGAGLLGAMRARSNGDRRERDIRLKAHPGH